MRKKEDLGGCSFGTFGIFTCMPDSGTSASGAWSEWHPGTRECKPT